MAFCGQPFTWNSKCQNFISIAFILNSNRRAICDATQRISQAMNRREQDWEPKIGHERRMLVNITSEREWHEPCQSDKYRYRCSLPIIVARSSCAIVLPHVPKSHRHLWGVPRIICCRKAAGHSICICISDGLLLSTMECAYLRLRCENRLADSLSKWTCFAIRLARQQTCHKTFVTQTFKSSPHCSQNPCRTDTIFQLNVLLFALICHFK